jgi:hypothetical protein
MGLFCIRIDAPLSLELISEQMPLVGQVVVDVPDRLIVRRIPARFVFFALARASSAVMLRKAWAAVAGSLGRF